MKTYLHVLALAACVAFLTASPASESREPEDGSGDGPEIVINDVVEKNVETNEDDSAVESEDNPTDLLDLEMNPEDNEIKVNEKIEDNGTHKLDKKKCQKCIRSHYHARHADFCVSCEQKNDHEEVKEDETSQTLKPNKRCVKCARKNFRARNEAFCSEQCSAEEGTKHHKNVHNKNKNKNKQNEAEEEETAETDESESDSESEVADVKVTNIVDEAETTTEQDSQSSEKKHTKKKKHHKHKNNKKNKKHTEKKEENVKSEADETSEEGQEEEKDTVKLGPLENLIRFLIKSNTYTH